MDESYTIVDMTKEEYLKKVCEWFCVEDGGLLMDEEGFMLPNGQYANDESRWPDPLPQWFNELPWSFPKEELDDGTIEPDEEIGYARLIDSDSDRLWEMPWF